MSDIKAKTYQVLAAAIGARLNCIASDNAEWKSNWSNQIVEIMKSSPSGSGIDSGTQIDLDASTSEKIVLTFGYHHMNENGYYDGWTSHKAIVKGSLQFGKTLTITGPNRNDIKDYLFDVFDCWLEELVDRYPTIF